MEEHIRETFIRLCHDAYEADLRTYNCVDIEPLLVEIVTLVKEYPNYRVLFVELFLQADKGEFQSPPDLLPFTMRELRFNEVYQVALQELSEGDKNPTFARRMNHLSHLIHAFEDVVWEDADMWPYYSHELKPKDK
jgi:hypothetical protein